MTAVPIGTRSCLATILVDFRQGPFPRTSAEGRSPIATMPSTNPVNSVNSCINFSDRT